MTGSHIKRAGTVKVSFPNLSFVLIITLAPFTSFGSSVKSGMFFSSLKIRLLIMINCYDDNDPCQVMSSLIFEVMRLNVAVFTITFGSLLRVFFHSGIASELLVCNWVIKLKQKDSEIDVHDCLTTFRAESVLYFHRTFSGEDE